MQNNYHLPSTRYSHDLRAPHARRSASFEPAFDPGRPRSSAREPRRVSSDELIGPGREVLIRHAGFDYRLRITRQGKLILTK